MKRKFSLLLILAMVLTLFIPITSTEAATLKINKAKATLEVDATLQLKLGDTSTSKATWTSSKKSIATVSKTGVVTAKSEGKSTITATVNKTKFTCIVTVVNSNKSVAPTPTPVATSTGTRTNPLIAFKENKITIIDYADGEQTVNLKLVEVKDGEEANSIIAEENMFNEIPSSKNRWVLYHFSLEFVKGKGEFYASDIINSSVFYNSNATKSLTLETASFSNELSGLDTYSVSLYEGGKSDFYIAVLLDNTIDYTTIKIDCGYDKNFKSIEKWLTTKN